MNIWKLNIQALKDKKKLLGPLNATINDRIGVLNEYVDVSIARADLVDELARHEELLLHYEVKLETRRKAKERELEEYIGIINSPVKAKCHFSYLYEDFTSKNQPIPVFEWEIPFVLAPKRVNEKFRSISLCSTFMSLAANVNHTKRVATHRYKHIIYTSVNAAKKRIEALDTAIARLVPDLVDLKDLVNDLVAQLADVKQNIGNVKHLLDADCFLPEGAEYVASEYRALAIQYFDSMRRTELSAEPSQPNMTCSKTASSSEECAFDHGPSLRTMVSRGRSFMCGIRSDASSVSSNSTLDGIVYPFMSPSDIAVSNNKKSTFAEFAQFNLPKRRLVSNQTVTATSH